MANGLEPINKNQDLANNNQIPVIGGDNNAPNQNTDSSLFAPKTTAEPQRMDLDSIKQSNLQLAQSGAPSVPTTEDFNKQRAIQQAKQGLISPTAPTTQQMVDSGVIQAPPPPQPFDIQKAKQVSPLAPTTAQMVTQQQKQAAETEKRKEADKALTAPKTAVKPVEEVPIEQQAKDLVAQVLDPEGASELVKQQFNQQMNLLSPQNAAMRDFQALQLKQAGLDGQGAGNAIMANLARQQGVQTSELVANLTGPALDTLIQTNKWGIDKAQEMKAFDLKYKASKIDLFNKELNRAFDLGISDPGFYSNLSKANGVPLSSAEAQKLADFSTAGLDSDLRKFQRDITSDYELDRTRVNDQVPGITYLPDQFANLDQGAKNDINNSLSFINGLISKNDLAGAQQEMINLATRHSNVFGDPSNYADWDPRDVDRLGETQRETTILNDAVIRFNEDPQAAIDLVANEVIGNLNIDSRFQSTWDSMSQDRKDELLVELGMNPGDTPLTPEEKQEFLAVDRITNARSNRNVVNQLYNDVLEVSDPEFKNWLTESSENSEALRGYLRTLSLGSGYNVGEDGIARLNLAETEAPWDPNSKWSVGFIDWPIITALDDRKVYDGWNPNADNNWEDAPEYETYQNLLNNAYDQYIRDRGDKGRQDWFEEFQPRWDGSELTYKKEQTPVDGEVPIIGEPGGIDDLENATIAFGQSKTFDTALELARQGGDIPIRENITAAFPTGQDAVLSEIEPYNGLMQIGDRDDGRIYKLEGSQDVVGNMTFGWTPESDRSFSLIKDKDGTGFYVDNTGSKWVVDPREMGRTSGEDARKLLEDSFTIKDVNGDEFVVNGFTLNREELRRFQQKMAESQDGEFYTRAWNALTEIKGAPDKAEEPPETQPTITDEQLRNFPRGLF